MRCHSFTAQMKSISTVPSPVETAKAYSQIQFSIRSTQRAAQDCKAHLCWYGPSKQLIHDNFPVVQAQYSSFGTSATRVRQLCRERRRKYQVGCVLGYWQIVCTQATPFQNLVAGPAWLLRSLSPSSTLFTSCLWSSPDSLLTSSTFRHFTIRLTRNVAPFRRRTSRSSSDGYISRKPFLSENM